MSCTNDTDSISLSVTGGILTADLVLDPDPANAASVGVDGLFVAGANETGWFSLSETFTYVSFDASAATGTMTVVGDKTAKFEAGQRFKLTQTTVRYFIITAVAYDSGTGLTTVTIWGGTDYTLSNAAITDPFYSPVKKPLGFPANPNKWMVRLADAVNRSQSSPVYATWYNVGALSITVPIGAWKLSFMGVLRVVGSGGGVGSYAALSTANNAASDAEMIARKYVDLSINDMRMDFYKQKDLTLVAKTIYYAVVMKDFGTSGAGSIELRGLADATTVLQAVSAYL